jgi:hypothetical protein
LSHLDLRDKARCVSYVCQRRTSHIMTKCIEINVTVIITYQKYLTSELNIIPWRHKVDWETPPRLAHTPRYRPPPGPPVLLLCGGLYIVMVSSQKIIAQQVVRNNVHEFTKGGSSCEV